MADKVIVYSTPLCAPCEQVKAYLRRHGVDFVVKDLLMDEDAAERLESFNIRSAPALEVDGEILAGPDLNPDRIDEVLGL